MMVVLRTIRDNWWGNSLLPYRACVLYEMHMHTHTYKMHTHFHVNTMHVCIICNTHTHTHKMYTQFTVNNMSVLYLISTHTKCIHIFMWIDTYQLWSTDSKMKTLKMDYLYPVLSIFFQIQRSACVRIYTHTAGLCQNSLSALHYADMEDCES